jgi:hypothetical protein
MKKANKYFLLLDCESTQPCEANNRQSHVFDFAYLLIRKSDFAIIEQGAYILRDFCNEPLFYSSSDKNGIWSKKALPDRTEKYRQMLRTGQRELITVPQLNAVLMMINCNYSPVLMAYNLSFDYSLGLNSGLVLRFFKEKQCLMKMAIQIYLKRRGYWVFCLRNNLLSEKNFLRFSAQAIGGYLGIQGNEPHTALEDLLEWEYPILCNVLRQHKKHDPNFKLDWQSLSLPFVYNQLHGA